MSQHQIWHVASLHRVEHTCQLHGPFFRQKPELKRVVDHRSIAGAKQQIDVLSVNQDRLPGLLPDQIAQFGIPEEKVPPTIGSVAQVAESREDECQGHCAQDQTGPPGMARPQRQ